MRPSTRKWLLCAAAVLLLLTAASRVHSINATRDLHYLTLPPLPKTVRPSLLLTPLMAVGRAPIVDYLWLRATKLKDQGRFFDAHQLAEIICELQPKFASVWAFQAWNMSYNISVTLKTPEERWRWVRNGFELLRDKGIPLNPNNTQLYKELAWILYHKVGDFMDEWQGYYKLQFALLMEDILGPPPVDWIRPGRVDGDYYRDYDFASLVAAPQSTEELMKSPGVEEFADRLMTFGYDIRTNGVFLGLLQSQREGRLKVPNAKPGDEENKRHDLEVLLTQPETNDVRRTIEKYWRSYRLRNEVKLDPQRIVDIQKGIGVTLDFRLAESHALYWAHLGMEKGRDSREHVDLNRLNTQRVEFYCLQKMFQRGRMALGPQAKEGEPPLLSPDIRVAPALRDAFIRDSKEYVAKEYVKKEVSTNFETGFVGFMRSAIIRYHELGMKKQAQEFFDQLKSVFPDPMYAKGIDYFLKEQFKFDREINDFRIAMARIESLLLRGLTCYAYGEDEEAVRYINRAREIYDLYNSTISSKRLVIPVKFTDMIERIVHEQCAMMFPASYETICKRLNLKPLPRKSAPTTQPT